MPGHRETLLDDGYCNMHKVMKALVEVDFDGIAIPDHVPAVGDVSAGEPGRQAMAQGREYRPNPGLAYLIAYMRALHGAALTELKKA